MLKRKGFTLVEVLVAMLLFGLLLSGVAAVISAITHTVSKVDAIAFSTSDVLYTVDLLQKDTYVAYSAYTAEDTLTLHSNENQIVYEVNSGRLYRNSSFVCEVIYGNFEYDKVTNSVGILLLLPNNAKIDTTLYLKG